MPRSLSKVVAILALLVMTAPRVALATGDSYQDIRSRLFDALDKQRKESERPKESEGPKGRTPKGWSLDLAPLGEPGDRLVMSGRVLSDSGPLAGVTVYAYHADAHGIYAKPGDRWPRLAGVLRTDARGRYRIRTVMPSGYARSTPHIHFEVWGRGISRGFATINFRRPGETPTSEPSAAPEGGTFAQVERDSGGGLRCDYDLRVGKAR